jgi:hypothetical protein
LARNDVDPHASAISRREAPEVCLEFCPLQTEGVGNAGRTVHPQSRVQGWKVERTRVVTVAPESPGIPARNGLTAYTVLSPVTGLSCHRRPRKLPFANLTPASGRQDHTVLPYATRLSPKPSAGLVPVRRNSSESGNSAIRRTLRAAESEHIACLTPPRPSYPAPRQ